MKKLLFRADAAPHIGIGDLMSFINLSHRFPHWEIFFIIKDYPAALNLVKKYKIENVTFIQNDISILNEIIFINNFIELNNVDFIFLQINETNLAQYDNINIRFKGCVYFETHLPKGYDVVLSWNHDSEKYFNYREHSHTKFFVGSEYVILPSNFNYNKIKKRNLKHKKESILISMGGADEYNLTLKIIQSLNNIKCKQKLTILLGAGYEYKPSLQTYLENSNLSYKIKSSIKDMFTEYINCDLAIGTGGLTVSELIATKTPSIIIAAYKHQENRCNYFHNKGFINYKGYKNTEITKEDILFIPHNTNFNPKIEGMVNYIDKMF